MNEILHVVKSHRLFKDLPAMVKARIIPLLEVISVAKGKKVYLAKQEADAIYFVCSGSIKIDGKEELCDKGTFFGEESYFKSRFFGSDALAKEESTIIRIPVSALDKIKAHNEDISSILFSSFTQTKSVIETVPVVDEGTKISALISWVFAFIVPVFIHALLDDGIASETRLFISILSSGVIFWVFGTFHESIPGLIIIAASLILGLVPPAEVLAGFSSSPFILVMSLWGIGLLLIQSGLIQRILLYLIRYLPSGSGFYNVALFFLGGLMTPAIPSIVNRAKVGAPMVEETLDILGIPHGTTLSTKISASIFFGITILSSVFFTGSVMNFVVFGLLPLQEQQNIITIGWFYSAGVVGGVLSVFYLVTSSIFFATRTKINVSKPMIDLQIKARASMSSQEVMALGCVIFFVISLFTTQYHRIPIEWVSLFLLFAILSMNLIGTEKWQKDTDWSFLVFLATIIGINKCMQFLGVDNMFLSYILPLLKAFISEQDLGKLIMVLVGIMVVVRLILPIGPAIALLSAIMVPVSESFGLSLWVLGFVLLMSADIWWFPYQSPFYTKFTESFSKALPYKESSFLLFNALMNIGRIAAIYLSLPFWKSLGLMFN
ncbi:MAG: anion permease [Alphaproteobacteria bacterium]|nr:MAG: anion permease [Alphaproteobacteria bacterium]